MIQTPSNRRWRCLLGLLTLVPIAAMAQQQTYYPGYYQWRTQPATTATVPATPSPAVEAPTSPAPAAVVPATPPSAPAPANAAPTPAVAAAEDVQSPRLPAKMGQADSRLGRVLTDASGRTLYVSDHENSGIPLCTAACSRSWSAMIAEVDSQVIPPFYPVAREDGSRQWSWNGRPLYRWIGDRQPGDVTGDGVNGVWHAVRL